MSERRAPDWLGDFQARFGTVLRTPLDRSTGTLRATPSAYDPAVDAPPGRLAVYNRQYWFRLFSVLQDAFPLTTRLFGHWLFNDHATRFLLERPPSGWDVGRVPDGFEAFLAGALDTPDRDAVLEAARIDAAWRRIFTAPPAAPYRPTPQDAARLLDARLVPSPALALIEEHWPLLELRRKVLGDAGEARVPLPPRLPRSSWWALVRTDAGIGRLPLDAREGELMELLQRVPVRDALAQLEAACEPAERAGLPERTRAWLARSVQLDFWVGIEPGPA